MPQSSNNKQESIRRYLKEKNPDEPGISAIFSALKDIDGIGNSKKAKIKSEKKERGI